MVRPASSIQIGTKPRSPLAWWGIIVVAGLLAVILVVVVLVYLDRRQFKRAEALRLAKIGRMAEAEAYFDEALAHDPNDVELLKAQVVGFLAARQLEEASRALSRWRALRPEDVEAHFLMIELSLKQNLLTGAIDGAGEVLRRKPSYADLRQQRANWLFLVGRTEEADQECRRCREIRPDDLGLLMLHAEICYRLGDSQRTEQLVEGVLRRDPNAGPALILRGAILLDAGQPELAIPVLRAALGGGGENEQRARHYLSLALARTGQETEAKQIMAEAKRQQTVELWKKYGQPDSAAYKVSLAESLLDTGKAEEAVQLLEQVVAQTPSCSAAHRLLARHFEAQGQTARAAEHRRKASD